MPRYAKANVTIHELKAKIESLNGIWSILNEYTENDIPLAPKVLKDLSKIDVDSENAAFIGEYYMPGTEKMPVYEMLGDFPVVWCACGGDWESPLVFVLYIGEKEELRAYIPSNGNVYNHKLKCAYGSEGHCEGYEVPDESENEDDEIIIEPKEHFNYQLLKEDVKNRIQVKK